MKLSTYIQCDPEEIRQLFYRVFSDSEGQDQGRSVSNLAYDLMTKTDEKDLYGFVATEENQVIGCIFFSRLTLEEENAAFILSPVAILTDHQERGIGQKLINFGINLLKDDGVKMLFTYGSPEYYSKVGFHQISEDTVKAPVELTMPFGWLGQSLSDRELVPIKGESRCVEALNNPEYW